MLPVLFNECLCDWQLSIFFHMITRTTRMIARNRYLGHEFETLLRNLGLSSGDDSLESC
jgi:hypothetical protein